MDGSEITEVCRLCPSSDNLLDIFDKCLSITYNMREIVLLTTGIEILENDVISKKICHKCRSITLRMFQFRQDALKQDQELKEKCAKLLVRGIKIPTCITLKKEISSTRPEDQQLILSKGETETNRSKVPKENFADNVAPVVSLTMGEVENYFITNKLDMKKFIHRPHPKSASAANKVAKKRTSVLLNKKLIVPLSMNERLFSSNNTNDNYTETGLKLKRKRLNSPSLESSDTVFCEKSGNVENIKVPEISFNSKLQLESPKMPEQNLKAKDSERTDFFLFHPPVESLKVGKQNPTSEHALMPKIDGNMEPAAQLEKSVPTLGLPSSVNGTKPQAEDAEIKTTSKSASSAIKPTFIESIGLMSTVATAKSHTIHTCNLCGSVHTSLSKLKRHSHKHMVCQFCKIRFKSLCCKKRHIHKNCYVKKLMNTRSTVQLEKVEFNCDIRRRYKNAFSGFPPLEMAEADIPIVVPTPIIIDVSSICFDAEKEVQVEADIPIIVPTPIIIDMRSTFLNAEKEVPIEATSQNIADSSVEYATPPDDIIILSDDEICDTILHSPPLTMTTTPRVLEVPATVPNSSIVKPDVQIKNDLVLNMITSPFNDRDLIKTLFDLKSLSRSLFTNKYVQTDIPSNKDIKINHAVGTCEFKNLKKQLTSYNIPIILEFGSFAVEYIDDSISAPKHQEDFWDNVPFFDVQDYLAFKDVKPGQNDLHVPASCFLLDMTALPLNHATMKPTPTKTASSVPIIENILFSVNYPVTSTNFTANSSSIIPVLSKSITNTKTVSSNVPKRAFNSTLRKIFPKHHTHKSPSSADRKSLSDNNASSSESSKFRVKNVWELK